MTSKVRKKWTIFKINRKCGRFKKKKKKSGSSSALSEDLAGLQKFVSLQSAFVITRYSGSITLNHIISKASYLCCVLQHLSPGRMRCH